MQLRRQQGNDILRDNNSSTTATAYHQHQNERPWDDNHHNHENAIIALVLAPDVAFVKANTFFFADVLYCMDQQQQQHLISNRDCHQLHSSPQFVQGPKCKWLPHRQILLGGATKW